MSSNLRLDLLLKEVQDHYSQENFRKIKRAFDCLVDTGIQGSRGIQGPAGAPGHGC